MYKHESILRGSLKQEPLSRQKDPRLLSKSRHELELRNVQGVAACSEFLFPDHGGFLVQYICVVLDCVYGFLFFFFVCLFVKSKFIIIILYVCVVGFVAFKLGTLEFRVGSAQSSRFAAALGVRPNSFGKSM